MALANTTAAMFMAQQLDGSICYPVNFPYWAFALLIDWQNGIGSGMFAAPNSSSIMGSVPGPAPWRGLGHALHVPELRHGPVHRACSSDS